MFEQLERRMLLSVTASFANGIVSVKGNNAADVIDVEVTPGNTNGAVVVKRGDTIIYDSATHSDLVTKIDVSAGGGNDRITLNNNEGAMDIVIDAGKGDDTVQADTFHVKGPTIRGGDGDDEISVSVSITGSKGAVVDGGAGDDTIEVEDALGGPSTVRGGAGDDDISAKSDPSSTKGHLLTGGDGDDLIRGGIKNDVLAGDAGKDRILGGDGDDLITGNDGNDRLYGQAGDDTLLAGSGKDLMVGGTGNAFFQGDSGKDTADERDNTGLDSDTLMDDVEVLLQTT